MAPFQNAARGEIENGTRQKDHEKLTQSEWQQVKGEADRADLPLAIWTQRALLLLADEKKAAESSRAC